MKTRTKGFILSFILVFAMLIGVFTMMPMTASAANQDGSTDEYGRTFITEEQLFEEMDISFRLGYTDYAVMGQKGFTETRGNGWELSWNKQEVSGENVYNVYNFTLRIRDYDTQQIAFDYDVKSGYGEMNNHVTFTIIVNGECDVSYISVRSADELNVLSSLLAINFGEGSSLRSTQIFHAGVGQDGGTSQLQLVGPDAGNAYLHVGEICSSALYRSFGERHYLDGQWYFPYAAPVRGYAWGNLTITNSDNRTVFTEPGCWWSFAEEVDLFLNTSTVPVFTEYKDARWYLEENFGYDVDEVYVSPEYSRYEFNQPNKIGDPFSSEFAAYSNKQLQYLTVEVGTYIPTTAKVGDSIDYYFWPTVADSLASETNNINPFESAVGFQVESGYELTNLSSLKEVASDSKLGSLYKSTAYKHDYNKDYFTYVSDKVPTFTEPGIYRLTISAKLNYWYGNNKNKAVITEDTRTYYIVVDDENATCFDWITGGSVNSTPCADGETIKVPSNSATDPLNLKITYKNPIGLGEMEAEGWRLGVRCTKMIDNGGWVACEDYFESMTGDEITLTLYGNTDHAGSTRMFRVYLTLYKGNTQIKTDVYTVYAQVVDKYINIDSANINVGTPVAGQTPADVKGTLTTEGLTINKETWYEVNGNSLRAMADDEEFVAGKQYRYEAFVASTAGYQLASDFYLKINDSFASGNGGLWKMRGPITAKAAFTAEAVKNEVTVIKGDTVTLKVNATGDGLEYVWQGDETVGAPSVGVNFRDNITLECVNAGTYTYKCIVKDANGNRETVTFTVTVIAPNMSGTVLPAEPVFNGEGFIGVEDSDNITVTKNGSIVLKPDFTFGNSGAIGEISYTWEIYDASYKRIGKITTENLVITADSEIINSKTVGTYVIMLTIGNKAGDVHESMFTGATVYVVEPESTGTVTGLIEEGEKEASPYALRRFSARSSTNFEGTIVYLVRENEIVYATEANAQGYYTFTNVLYGSYSVMIEKEGYEDYNEPVEVNAEEVTHDVTIIVHECFKNEAGLLLHIEPKDAVCDPVTDGSLGNIEYYSCQACGKFYDAERNLIADSVADPYSVNDMGVPYKAIIYPVHDYCGEAQEGGDADRYLRHRADNCIEETTYWYYCIYCRKSAGDDPSAVDKYYVGSASNQTHSYTLEIADEYYFYQGGETCKDKIWYYHACEYCYAKADNQIWESNYYGAHAYGTLIPAQGEVHTPNELKAGVAAYYFCDVCDTYFDEAFIETTLEMLTGATPEHSYTNENGYKGADGHANTCSCGAKDTVVPHVDGNTNHECDTCQTAMGTHEAASGKHTCDYCNQAVTECADDNKDHKCDTCGTSVGIHDAATGKHTCDYCGKTVSECTDSSEDDDSKCDICGKNVGDCVDVNKDHKCDKHGEDMGTHEAALGKHTCDYCGAKVTDCADENKDHKCDTCSANVGTHEAATGKHTCDYCGKTVTECADDNKDHKCDTCSANVGTHEAATGKHTCDYCGKTVTECADANSDGKCDTCGADYGDCVDSNKDHLCDKHGESIGTHEAALGKHTCDYCGAKVTDCADGNKDHKCDTCSANVGTHEAATGKHTCDYCGKTVTECADSNKDHKCDTCQTAMGTHEAANGKHTCDYCGEAITECGDSNSDGKCDTCNKDLGTAHTHTFVEGKCECGETDPNYVPPHEHTFVEGKCECGETDPNYTPETNDPGTDVPGTDEPGTDDPNAGNTEDPTDDNDGLPTGAIIAIVAGSVVVGGAGIFALVWFVIKKKTWAEFLAIFKKG